MLSPFDRSEFADSEMGNTEKRSAVTSIALILEENEEFESFLSLQVRSITFFDGFKVSFTFKALYVLGILHP